MLLAVVLAGLATAAVVVYVRGVKQQSTTTSGSVSVVVAKSDIPAGAKLDDLIASGGFTTRSVPKAMIVQGAITSVAELQGKTAAQPILAGEQISTARLMGGSKLGGGALSIPAGYVALSLPLNLSEEAGGAIVRGDHVTVYASFAQLGTGKDQGDVTLTLVPDAQVLKAMQPEDATGGGALRSSSGNSTAILTLALRPEDAQRVAYAQENGSIWLALLPPGQAGVAHSPVYFKQVA